jgi:Glycosyl hydrolase family 115/Gylcosyl hydrolase family 115 C-terminal domain
MSSIFNNYSYQKKVFLRFFKLLFGIGLCIFILTSLHVSLAADNRSYVTAIKGDGSFTLSSSKSALIVAGSQDYPGVVRVLKQLQEDIRTVTGLTPRLSFDRLEKDAIPVAKEFVLVGTLGRNPLIDKLVQEKKLDVQGIAGKWETFLIQVVENPFPHVDRVLIIAGSDKRGTIYGIYDLSEKIGVSPWYWWADVPVKKQSALFVSPGRYTRGEPKVKYRGIFINDEAPALSGMVYEKFGGYNSKFYDHVFELILRLRGNYLWPAMWNNSFSTDDTLNPKLADEYGIVMGTSHHEPMMRAWKEWEWAGNKRGSWDYSKNADSLRRYWKQGIQRSKEYEEVVTLAMRGDGDEPMSEGANINLLQNIVKDQRKILGEITGKNVTTIPQVWALYKEVQEYYDKGMRMPDDVTVLLCDDNWGNIRKLPKPTDSLRLGGYGIYYHYDFVGGPRNYKWLNTIQIERVWEQMHLAYHYGADRIWIVNVGDLKPMEFPISFFLDYAWNPEQWPAERIPEYTQQWAEQQFGQAYSIEIAEILNAYTKFNSRRKPEMLSPETYSVVNYREAETVVAEYNALVKKAQQISNALPAEYKDAFYQLVLHQPSVCANLNDLYVTVRKNSFYAKQGRAATNGLAIKARDLFKNDSLITHYYNTVLAGGKWNHLMDQTHIGYTSWQEPNKNLMPEVKEIMVPNTAEMGVAIECAEDWWPNQKSEAVLPEFDVYNQQKYYIEIFNRGNLPFDYTIQTSEPWMKIDYLNGRIGEEKRLFVSVDWEKVPSGIHRVQITISGPNKVCVVVQAVINNPASPKRTGIIGFIESNGFVSMNAEHFTTAKQTKTIGWLKIPNLGRTGSAMTSVPVTAQAQLPGGGSPRLEYRVHLFSSGEVRVKTYLSPILNFNNSQGLRYAISFDDEPPRIVNIHENDTIPDWRYPYWWNQAVSENVMIEISKHSIQQPGKHILKFWMVDPGVVLQKIVIETGDVKPSYLGPPESFQGTTGRVQGN